MRWLAGPPRRLRRQVQGGPEEATPQKTTEGSSKVEEKGPPCPKQPREKSKDVEICHRLCNVKSLRTSAKAAQPSDGNRSPLPGAERFLVGKFYLVIDGRNEGKPQAQTSLATKCLERKAE